MSCALAIGDSKLHVAVHPCQVWSVLVTDPRVRAAYAEGAGVYRIVPAAVAVPRGVEELQELVRWAGATGSPLVPRGAGSGVAGGGGGRGPGVGTGQGGDWAAPDSARRARAA